MNMRWMIASAAHIALFFVFAHFTTMSAAEVNVLSARAVATVLNEIGPEFEQTSGSKLNVISGLPSEFIKHIEAGAPVDLVVSGSSPVDRLIQEGRLVAATRIDLVRSGIGVGVRAGTPKPDISSVEAFKRTLLNAKSIGYLKVGSGVYLATLLDRLGRISRISASRTPRTRNSASVVLAALTGIKTLSPPTDTPCPV